MSSSEFLPMFVLHQQFILLTAFPGNHYLKLTLASLRGGGELGRPWYDSAKYLTKMNTFNDFVDVARWLVDDDASTVADISKTSIGKGLTIPSKLSCEGRSAGGLLIGASINQQPELFQAAILGVPFVDVACESYMLVVFNRIVVCKCSNQALSYSQVQ